MIVTSCDGCKQRIPNSSPKFQVSSSWGLGISNIQLCPVCENIAMYKLSELLNIYMSWLTQGKSEAEEVLPK